MMDCAFVFGDGAYEVCAGELAGMQSNYCRVVEREARGRSSSRRE